ncbi:hypothetical protein GCM10023208_31080 [Erythrobacter westpacificensis]|uniref:Autotransporter outer membrane beta-barrel domain-containing protein n=1 Tax=Erythrobacter westpacificensis TaxID=1055231 RepID=A0ABP9KMJ9_9SPHN
MSAGGTARRGWPLLSLGMVLGSWVIVRVALWEAPFPAVLPPSEPAPATADAADLPAVSQSQPIPESPAMPQWLDEGTTPYAPPKKPLPEIIERPDFAPPEMPGAARAPQRSAVSKAGLRGVDRIIAHSMLLAAGYSAGRQDGEKQPYQSGVGPVAPGVIYAPEAAQDFAHGSSRRRWSMDLWALWREDTTTPITSGRPSYGRSQAGAVMRYRLDPASRHAPQLHLRATRALDGERETDVALGASARLLPSVPVRLAAEARVSETDAGTELRGAAYAVTELPPVSLPAGLTGEAYVQGGYVTGEFATPFVDGQARITRELASAGDFRLTAGGGMWGGAQEDAERLDVGPSAGLSFRIGAARGRVSADYRFRVAGDAEPSSGPALTLTAGF